MRKVGLSNVHGHLTLLLESRIAAQDTQLLKQNEQMSDLQRRLDEALQNVRLLDPATLLI